MPTTSDRRRPFVPAFLAALVACVLVACGGSDGNLDGPAAAVPATSAAPVARVEILSDSAWLPGNGQTKQLAAQAYDAAGNPVSTTISWASSRASNVAVDASGRLTSQVPAGSAQITAQADGVASAPLLAYVATPASGVVLVDDANIVGPLVETDPAAPPSIANTYQATLSGIAPPAVGTLLLGRGDKSLAGKVTAVTTTGAQIVATLQLVPLPELFADLEIEEIVDLSRAEVLIPPDVQAQFNVARNGNTWSFTPKATPTTARARPQAVTGTHARDILPFRSCEVGLEGYDELSNLPIGLEPPTFGITLSPSLDVRYDRRSGLTRFVVSAEPKVTMGATLQASVPIKGEMKCLLQLFALRLPIGGPLAFFIGGMVPVGVGFELAATATLATFKIGAQSEIGTKLSAGWNCPGPTCEFVRSIEDSTATLTPVFDAPNPIEDARLESKLNLFGYLEAELGNPFLRSLRFKAFEERLGAGFKGNFAPPLAQVLDAAYAADYALSVKGEAKLGTGIDDIVTLLGLGSLTSIDLDIERELARSPRALKVEADRATFATGDMINTKVTLDPATLNFLGVYNVDSVQLRRRVGSVTEVLATLNASTGQQVFDLSVTAPNDGEVSEWTAFVITRLLNFELASLELGQPTPLGVRVGAAFPAAMLPGDTATFTLTAMDHNSQPVAGLHVGIEVSGGTVSRSSGNTDANGQFMVLATLGLHSPSISVTATVRNAPSGEVLDTITRTAVSLASSPRVRLLRRWSGREVPHLQVAAVFNYDSRIVFSDVKEDGPSNPEDFSNLSANLNAIGSGSFDGTSASAQAQGTVTETIRIVNGSFEDTHNAVSFSTQATMTDPPPYPNPDPNEVTHLATSYAFTSYTSCVAFEVMGRDVSFALEIRGSGSPEMLVSANLGVGVSAVARDIVQYSSRGPTVAESRAGVLVAGATYTFCSASVGKALWESWRRTQLQTTVNGQVDVRLSLRPVPQP